MEKEAICFVEMMQADGFFFQENNQKLEGQIVQADNDSSSMEISGIGCLPPDLLIEILYRLPAKVLCKFRCVSKPWQNLLANDEQLIARHMKQSTRNPLLLCLKNCSNHEETTSTKRAEIELTSIDLKGTITNKFRKLIDAPLHTFASCGHLAIFCSTRSIYACNPSTQEIVRLPHSPSINRFHAVGIGYLPLSNGYKIVHLFYGKLPGNGLMGCEIFTLKPGDEIRNGTWRAIGDYPHSCNAIDSPVCIDGTIYWEMYNPSHTLDFNSILSFDLEKEELKTMSYPRFHPYKFYSFMKLTGHRGSLCAVGYSAAASVMDIWLLKDNTTDKWVKEYRILFPLRANHLIPSDDRSGELLIHAEEEGLINYSIETQSFSRVDHLGANDNYCKKACLYYDSLLSLHKR